MSRRYAAIVCGEARRAADNSRRNASTASRTRRLGLRLDPGPALRADERRARLERLLDHERRVAVRARHRHRLVPQREVAFGPARARVEDLALAALLLGQLALPALRTLDPDRERLRELALGPALAVDVAAVGAIARHETRAAQL